MTKKTNEQFTTVITPAYITATSNKVSKDFPQETPTKTVYFTTKDKKKLQELQDLGLTLYTPEDKSDAYFIVKATKSVKMYKRDNSMTEVDFKVEKINQETGEIEIIPNYYTDTLVYLAITKVKSDKGRSDFYRLTSILVNEFEDLKEVEQRNPFEDLINQ